MIDSRAGAPNMQDEMSLEHLDMLEVRMLSKKKKKPQRMGYVQGTQGPNWKCSQWPNRTEETHQVSIEMILAYLQKIDAG